MTKTSQASAILRHLKRGRSITPLQALDHFGSLRLGARIAELREAGHNIKTTMIKIGKKHIAKYTLARRDAYEA